MTARQLPASDYAKLKAATRQLISTSGGPVDAARVTRVDHQGLSRYGSTNEDHAERFMPADVIADIEAECGQPIVTRKLADLAGYLLVPVPQVARTGTVLGAVTAATLKETSDVFVALGESLGDGTVSQADAERIGREVDEAMAKLAALKLQVEDEAGRAAE
ncbi:phage regulatory CII family protein [Devosia sp. 1635]|uniref:phage regulatory CII family protein n=1 Tax=Devosia sp. 1635 TaxID=2726066 RepID=UPI0015655A14|nr:phage regulatory CII family protein [Devosia sp. 1635]